MKKLLIFVLIVFLLIALGVVTWFFLKEKDRHARTIQQTGQSVVAQPGVPRINIDQTVKDIKKEYKDDVQFQQCLGGTIESCLSSVISTKLQAGGDIKLCDDLLTDTAKSSCRFAHVMRLANESGDVAMCDKIENPQYLSSCRQEVLNKEAYTKKDLGVCDSLEESLKQRCREGASHRIARETKDDSWCDNIKADIIRDNCKQEVKLFKEQESRVRDTLTPEAVAPQETPSRDDISSVEAGV